MSGQDLTPLDRLLIEQAGARLIYRYAALIDAGQSDALAALFTETGRYARPAGPADVLEGRAAILAEFKSRPPRLMRHVVANVTVNAQSPTSASAHSRVVLYLGAPDGTLDKTMVGDFHDQLEKVGEDWLFAERRGSVTLKG